MTADMQARRTAAAAVLADYNALPEQDELWTTWAIWSERLAFHVQSLLYAGPDAGPVIEPMARVDGSIGLSFVRPDGSASLSRQDLLTVTSALATAAEMLLTALTHGNVHDDERPEVAARAQVHATLALAAATALKTPSRSKWGRVAGRQEAGG